MTDLDNHNRVFFRTALILTLLCAIAPIGAWLLYENNRDWTVSKLQRRINLNLPLGCNRERIEAWLDQMGMDHGYDEAGKGPKGTMAKLAGLKEEDVSGVVFGNLETRRANVGWGRNGAIAVRFYLDRQGGLASYAVYPIVYSL